MSSSSQGSIIIVCVLVIKYKQKNDLQQNMEMTHLLTTKFAQAQMFTTSIIMKNQETMILIFYSQIQIQHVETLKPMSNIYIVILRRTKDTSKLK